jgi:hypothetical protein
MNIYCRLTTVIFNELLHFYCDISVCIENESVRGWWEEGKAEEKKED